MSTAANRETLEVNSKGQTEKRTETVDHRSSAGKSHEQQKPVQVIHQPHSSSDTGGVLANAAASVATALESAKEAISQK